MTRPVFYTTRVAAFSDTVTYIGTAAAGASESDAVWKIMKLITDAIGNLTLTYPNGVAAFNQVWTDRESFSYS